MNLLDLVRPRWRHSNPTVRSAAVKKLTDLRILVALAKDKLDNHVRIDAGERLFQIWSELGRTSSDLEAKRSSLMSALLDIVPPEGCPGYLPSFPSITQVAWNLASVANPATIKALRDALNATNGKCRTGAVIGLTELGKKTAVEKLLSASMRDEIGEELLRLWDELSSKPDSRLRHALVNAFGALRVKGACGALQQALSEEFIGLDAVHALDQLPDEPVVEALSDFVRKLASGRTDRNTFLAAIRMLGKRGDRRAVEPLIYVYERLPSYHFREEAIAEVCRSLGQLGGEVAVGALIRAMDYGIHEARFSNDRSFGCGVRAAAMSALGKIGDPSAVEPLKAQLELADQRYMGIAPLMALARIGCPGIETLVTQEFERAPNPILAKQLFRMGNTSVCKWLAEHPGDGRSNWIPVVEELLEGNPNSFDEASLEKLCKIADREYIDNYKDDLDPWTPPRKEIHSCEKIRELASNELTRRRRPEQ